MDGGMMLNSTYAPINVIDFDSNKIKPLFKTIRFTASVNGTTNNDLAITDDCLLLGYRILVNGAVWGDGISVQIIDIDNILGFGANFVVASSVTDFPIDNNSQDQGHYVLQYPKKVPGLLYIRTIYNSTAGVLGIQPKVAIQYYLHQV